MNTNDTNAETKENRKTWAFAASVIVTMLTLVSFSASYSIYLESFRDWGWFGYVLAFGAAAGVEATFTLLVYGAAYALISGELAIAILGTIGLLLVMTANFVTHAKVVKGQALTELEQVYVTYIGPAAIFGSIFVILLIVFNLYESKERRQNRDLQMMTLWKAIEYKRKYINSQAMDDRLKEMNPAIEAEVMSQLGVGQAIPAQLPPAPRP